MSYLTPAEVGELLKVSPKTVSRWALHDATMPVVRLPGRLIRFEAQALERWLRAQKRRKQGADDKQVSEKEEESR